MNNRYVKIVLVALIALLVVLCALFLQQYFALRKAETLNFRRLWFVGMHTGVPLSAGDVGSIRSWMTFDYVDKAFNLPSSTLETSLRIADPRYPHLTILRYAARERIDPNSFLGEVQNAVRDALTTNTPR